MIPSRESYEGPGGWQDGRLGQAYDLVDKVRAENPDAGEVKALLAAIEAADIALAEIAKERVA